MHDEKLTPCIDFLATCPRPHVISVYPGDVQIGLDSRSSADSSYSGINVNCGFSLKTKAALFF